MKKPLLIAALLALCATIGFVFSQVEPPLALPGAPAPQGLVRYDNEALGLSFSYPGNFVLSEGAGPDRYNILLVRQEDIQLPENGEGPISVTVELFPATGRDLLSWVRGSSASNFSLGQGTLASTSVAGRSAVEYRWSGLYEGETTAFQSGQSIIAVSATWMSPADATRSAYQDILQTLRFSH